MMHHNKLYLKSDRKTSVLVGNNMQTVDELNMNSFRLAWLYGQSTLVC